MKNPVQGSTARVTRVSTIEPRCWKSGQSTGLNERFLSLPSMFRTLTQLLPCSGSTPCGRSARPRYHFGLPRRQSNDHISDRAEPPSRTTKYVHIWCWCFTSASSSQSVSGITARFCVPCDSKMPLPTHIVSVAAQSGVTLGLAVGGSLAGGALRQLNFHLGAVVVDTILQVTVFLEWLRRLRRKKFARWNLGTRSF